MTFFSVANSRSSVNPGTLRHGTLSHGLGEKDMESRAHPWGRPARVLTCSNKPLKSTEKGKSIWNIERNWETCLKRVGHMSLLFPKSNYTLAFQPTVRAENCNWNWLRHIKMNDETACHFDDKEVSLWGIQIDFCPLRKNVFTFWVEFKSF